MATAPALECAGDFPGGMTRAFGFTAVGPFVVLCADARLAVAKKPPKTTAPNHLLAILFIVTTILSSTGERHGVFTPWHSHLQGL